MILYRLVYYPTNHDDKYMADEKHEYLGNREAIFTLWFVLVREMGYKHVEVYDLDGILQHPERGGSGLQ